MVDLIPIIRYHTELSLECIPCPWSPSTYRDQDDNTLLKVHSMVQVPMSIDIDTIKQTLTSCPQPSTYSMMKHLFEAMTKEDNLWGLTDKWIESTMLDWTYLPTVPSNTNLFFSCNCNTRSSTVPSAMNRTARTGRCCPRRCVRSIACISAALHLQL